MSVTPEANPSLKWKGPSSGGAALPVEYDVDDPTFCSPKSVLSGLASGFCERWAVTHPEFIVAYNGGNSTTLNWNDANSAAAYRTSIVSNFVENIIAHNAAVESAFCENNGDFMAPEHPTASSASNYMTYMDNMITQLITSGGYYTTSAANSPSYSAFNQLAASANANAPAASACGLPVSNASAYTSQFLPAYPAAWAKERKWMLEQLRFVKTAGTMTDTTAVTGYMIHDYTSDDAVFYSQASVTATPAQGVVDITSAMQVMASTTVSGEANAHVRQKGGAYGGTISPSTSCTIIHVDSGQPNFLAYHAFSDGAQDAFSKTLERPYAPGDGLDGFLYGLEATTPGIASGTSVNLQVYLAGPVIDAEYAMNDHGTANRVFVPGGVTSTVNQTKSSVVVDTNGTAILTGTITVSYLCISSGGVASVGAGASLVHCNIMRGGKLIPTGNTLTFNILSEDYKPLVGYWEANSSATDPVTVSVVKGASVTAAAGSRYVVLQDGVTAGIVRYTGSTERVIPLVVVLSGGTYSVDGNLITSSAAVTDNGYMKVNHEYAEGSQVKVGAGGQLEILNNWQDFYAFTMEGSTLILGGHANGIYLNAEYGTTVSWPNTYTYDLNSIANADGNQVFSDRNQGLVLTVFHAHGLTQANGEALTSGWNTIETTAVSSGHCVLAGSTGASATANDKARITGATYTYPYDAEYGYDKFAYASNFQVSAGLAVLAINGGTVKPVVQDLYPSFKLRQNQT